MHTKDAQVLGVKDKETVSVKTPPGKRSVLFKEVIVRVSEQFKLEFHIDFDEANAAYLSPEDCVTISKTCQIT
jgi:putative phosphotransacetylase